MPGEISRPYQPPDTPEWREVFKALDEWAENVKRERERERQQQEEDTELPGW